MFTDIKNLNKKDFKNICRACMLKCDIKFFQDSVVSNVFFKLTNIQFESNNVLPEQICLKCFEKIIAIHDFKFQCLRTDSKFTKCLNNPKKLRLNKKVANTEKRNELVVMLKRISTNCIYNNELKYNQIGLNEDEISKICKFNEGQKINFSEDDLKNICRTCMVTCDIKFVLDNVLLNFFYTITQIQFEANVKLPQQICSKCFEKIKEIHEFKFQCLRTHTTLTKCNNSKKLRLNENEMDAITQNRNELVLQLERNSTNDFVNDEILKTSKSNYNQNINCSPDDLLTPNTNSNNQESNKKVNLNDLNENTNSSSCSNISSNNTKETPIENEDKQYKCNVCYKKFNDLTSFKNHKRVHSDERTIDSEVCNRTLTKVGTLNRYKGIHSENTRSYSGERSFKCDQCSKSFFQPHHLKLHMISHCSERPYKCDQCPKSFFRRLYLKLHMISHSSERPYKCDQCSKSFSGPHHLKRHMISHSIERPYKCDQCSKSFFRPLHLKHHMISHSGECSYKCDHCSKSFHLPHHLKRHMISHSIERPHKCDQCSKSFFRSDYLKRHKISHSRERPYKCDQCSKSFFRSDNLKRHMISHSSERPYKCDQCSRSFFRLHHLKRHMISHNSERPYKCDLCPKSFGRSDHLKGHQSCHSYERPYMCEQCSKTFMHRSSLIVHMRKHSDARLYKM